MRGGSVERAANSARPAICVPWFASVRHRRRRSLWTSVGAKEACRSTCDRRTPVSRWHTAGAVGARRLSLGEVGRQRVLVVAREVLIVSTNSGARISARGTDVNGSSSSSSHVLLIQDACASRRRGATLGGVLAASSVGASQSSHQRGRPAATVRLPQVRRALPADTTDVRDERAVIGVARVRRVFSEVVLEELEEAPRYSSLTQTVARSGLSRTAGMTESRSQRGRLGTLRCRDHARASPA